MDPVVNACTLDAWADRADNPTAWRSAVAELSAKGPARIGTAKGPGVRPHDRRIKHRGPLLIVSCKNPVVWATGCAVAVVDLVDCRPMARADEGAALGELQIRAKAWVLKNPWRVEPVPITGRRGLYDVDLKL